MGSEHNSYVLASTRDGGRSQTGVMPAVFASYLNVTTGLRIQ